MSSKLSGCIEPQQRAHRAAVELEHAERVAARQQLVGRRVVERAGPRARRSSPRLSLMLSSASSMIGEVAQPQEVHLEQAERLARRVVELGDDRAVLLAAHDRDEVDQRLARHDHAGRVHAPLALEVLEPARGVDDLASRRGRTRSSARNSPPSP